MCLRLLHHGCGICVNGLCRGRISFITVHKGRGLCVRIYSSVSSRAALRQRASPLFSVGSTCAGVLLTHAERRRCSIRNIHVVSVTG